MDYVAFDFGDDTTRVAHYNDELSESGSAPQGLHIVRGSGEIWSVIGFDSHGENPIIGEAANRPGYKIFSNWKSKPSQYTSSGPDAWKRQAAVAFMGIVFDSFLSNNPKYTREGRCNGSPYVVVIGVPCDWDYNDIEEYQKIAKEAGLPNVQAVKECDALELYAHKLIRGVTPNEDIRNGVLLVDVRRSTTDFIYKRGADPAGHCGISLGTQAIAHAFLVETMKRSGFRYWADKQTFVGRVLAGDPMEGKRMYVRDTMRVLKYMEAYFRGVDQSADYYQETEVLPSAKESIGDISDGVGYLTYDYINRCLDDEKNSPCKFKLSQLSEEWDGAGLDVLNTWRGHFRSALGHIKRKWNIDSSASVVLIGGASRMQFVEEDVIEALSAKRTYFGNEESWAVCEGLAMWGHRNKICPHMMQRIKTKNINVTIGNSEFDL